MRTPNDESELTAAEWQSAAFFSLSEIYPTITLEMCTFTHSDTHRAAQKHAHTRTSHWTSVHIYEAEEKTIN